MAAVLAAVVIVLLTVCEPTSAPPPDSDPEPAADPTPRACPFARDGAPAGFDIEIEWRATYKRWLVAEVVECAAAYWETAIRGDVADFTSEGRFFDKGVMIDDLRVAISFEKDTPDLWGSPDAMAITETVIQRDGRGLPYYANIEFRMRESEYRDRAYLYNLARHEIGHAIGFGTTAIFDSLVRGGVFVGPTATRLAGGAPLYVDAGIHWRSTGPVELDIMVGGRLSGGHVVSVVTLGVFADLGYEVDLAQVGH